MSLIPTKTCYFRCRSCFRLWSDGLLSPQKQAFSFQNSFFFATFFDILASFSSWWWKPCCESTSFSNLHWKTLFPVTVLSIFAMWTYHQIFWILILNSLLTGRNINYLLHLNDVMIKSSWDWRKYMHALNVLSRKKAGWLHAQLVSCILITTQLPLIKSL